jgi:hypothetical protein
MGQPHEKFWVGTSIGTVPINLRNATSTFEMFLIDRQKIRYVFTSSEANQVHTLPWPELICVLSANITVLVSGLSFSCDYAPLAPP